ncbi:MAG: prolipoprotein diacylglyceryl transferase [Bdellovibrio sp.]
MFHWSPNPEIISFGFLHIRWYGLMFLIGFTVSLKTFKWICARENKPTAPMDSLFTYVVLGTTIGARLGHCLFYEPSYFFQHPIEIFAIWNGGLASHGGAIGVLISIFLFTKKYKEFSFLWLIDRASPMVAFTGGLIRIGNLMNSEIIGKPSQVPWAIILDKIDQIPRHPTQIYESLSYFFISIIGFATYRRFKSKPPQGLIFGLMISGIFIFRIIWEFFKENQEPFESTMLLNMGQVLSIPFIVIGFIFIGKALISKKKVTQTT